MVKKIAKRTIACAVTTAGFKNNSTGKSVGGAICVDPLEVNAISGIFYDAHPLWKCEEIKCERVSG